MTFNSLYVLARTVVEARQKPEKMTKETSQKANKKAER